MDQHLILSVDFYGDMGVEMKDICLLKFMTIQRYRNKKLHDEFTITMPPSSDWTYNSVSIDGERYELIIEDFYVNGKKDFDVLDLIDCDLFALKDFAFEMKEGSTSHAPTIETLRQIHLNYKGPNKEGKMFYFDKFVTTDKGMIETYLNRKWK